MLFWVNKDKKTHSSCSIYFHHPQLLMGFPVISVPWFLPDGQNKSPSMSSSSSSSSFLSGLIQIQKHRADGCAQMWVWVCVLFFCNTVVQVVWGVELKVSESARKNRTEQQQRFTESDLQNTVYQLTTRALMTWDTDTNFFFLASTIRQIFYFIL